MALDPHLNPSGIISRVTVSRILGGAAGNHTVTGIDPVEDKIISVIHVAYARFYSQSLDVASVAANTSAEQTFTVTGLKTTDIVYVNKPALNAGLGIVNCRVSAADTLAITFMNSTAGAIDPAAETYEIVAIPNTGPEVADLTSEFRGSTVGITAADTINNTGGTATTGGLLVVSWYDADWGRETNAGWISE